MPLELLGQVFFRGAVHGERASALWRDFLLKAPFVLWRLVVGVGTLPAFLGILLCTFSALTIASAQVQSSALPPPPEDAPDPSLQYGSPFDAAGAKGGLPPLPTVGGAGWVSVGPGPIINGQLENIFPDNEAAGAVHAVAAHPTDPDILYIGAINGGVWKTTNATALRPAWTPLTDQNGSLSISALEFDPTDPTHQTLLAGTGFYSSFLLSGPLIGVLYTSDGGATWAELDGGGSLTGINVSGVAPRGSTLVVSAALSFATRGIQRSTDGGATFSLISGTNGLPSGAVLDMVGDPNVPARLYAAVQEAGIFRSDDTGLTWTDVTDPAMTSVLTLNNNNTEMGVHNNGVTNAVYVGIVDLGSLVGFFRSTDLGASWTAMDIPESIEGGTPVGLQPNPKPGSQGGIHFSVLADPVDPNLVYAGGDRQPLEFSSPSSIGARNFTGRLFRGDASQAPGSQWVHMTHSDVLPTPGTLGGTANMSAPHADSREMVFDAAGDIIEGDDGGVYRRTSPRDNTGDWFSINGNLGIAEFHDVAYDPNARIFIGGAQDNGTSAQLAPGDTVWRLFEQGDGGDVAIDTTTVPDGFSLRYTSFQRLGGFRRNTYDASGNFFAQAIPALTVLDGAGPLSPWFVQPIELNEINPTRIIFPMGFGVYESLDQGETLTQLATDTAPLSLGFSQVADYGGRIGIVPNEDVIWAGYGREVFVRTTAADPMTLTAYSGLSVHDIIMDPDDWRTAYAVDSQPVVYLTTDTGATWVTITGDLAPAKRAWSFEFIPNGDGTLLIGTDLGVFASSRTNLGAWTELGTNLPNALVFDMEYVAAEDFLLVATLGRGAWTFANVSAVFDFDAPFVDSVSVQSELVVRIVFNERMGNGALTPANYTVSGSGSGTLSANPDSVAYLGGNVYSLQWNIGRMIFEGNVTITAANMQDVAGNNLGDPDSGTDIGGAIAQELPLSPWPVALVVLLTGLWALRRRHRKPAS